MSSQTDSSAPLAAIEGSPLVPMQNGQSNAQKHGAVGPPDFCDAAIAYCRVSTAEQALGLSLQDQTHKLGLTAEAREWSVRVMVEDRSAKDDNRPVLQEALALLAAGEAVALMVTRLDRLTRRTADFYMLMDRAAKEGWALVCLEPAVDMTSAFGRAMGGMAAVFAQLERELIAQRQRDSVAIRKAEGVYVNNPSKLDPAITEMVCAMRAEGWVFSEIGKALMQAGHMPPKGGATWHPNVLTKIYKRGTP